MKAHIIIKFRRAIPGSFPSWQRLLSDPSVIAPPTISPQIDQILLRNNLPVLVTAEYAPENGFLWSSDEISSGFNRIFRLILKESRDIPENTIPAIASLPEVEYARLGIIGRSTLPDQNRLQLAQSSLLEKSHRLIHLKEAQFYTKGDPQIKIAVLDTGIDTAHPEISHAIEPGKDFVNIIEGAKDFIGDFLDFDDSPEDEVGHGTHVAGIIASAGKKMPVGVAPQCKIVPVRVLGALKNGAELVGAGLIDNINTGIKWAVDYGVDIINMSLGIKHEGGGLPHQEVIAYALHRGVTVVAASGNDGHNDKYYPGALEGVLAVGAVDENDQIAQFSTFGSHVSLVAPGTNIYSSYKDHNYALSSGTSQASPFVSGAIALLKSYGIQNGVKLGDAQIKYILKSTADKPDSQIRSDKWGYGRINLIDAIKLLDYKLNIKKQAS